MCCKIHAFLFVLALPALALAQRPEPSWRNEISFPDDPFQSWTSPPYVKFTIITTEGYDPNVVYFQDSRKYEYHFDFALENLEPFIGLTIEQFDEVTLHAADQQAILGAVILPPWADPSIQEYGIQLVRHDPYTREEVVSLFQLVQNSIVAEPNVTAYYFPTYEQYPPAQQNRDWFADQGLPLGSTAQWAQGNAGYSGGWALGTVKFVPGSEIQAAYTAGELLPEDILLTDGVPAEVPSVAGIMTLMPSTPNSHVAILARSQGVPFVYLALDADAARASDFVGQDMYLAVTKQDYEQFYTVVMLDAGALSAEEKGALLALKGARPLVIEPMSEGGAFWADTSDLQPADIGRFGGKAANFGILREALPDSSPEAMAFSFDLWKAFLDQPLSPAEPIVLGPGEHALFLADDDAEQGPYHTSFRLKDDPGEDIGLFDRDGLTLIDGVSFGSQRDDVSYGRSIDGGEAWQFLENPSPGAPNSAGSDGNALVINEFMADNNTVLEDPDEAGESPDWIELFNGSAEPVTLSGLFLTDDLQRPTRWQIPVAVTGPTLRDEIALRLSNYTTYPPAEMKALSADLAAIRNLFKNPHVTGFDAVLESAVTDALMSFGFDADKKIRFRSSTNVEDSEQFTGAGLYESYSGSLTSEPGILEAIRKVFASFYNDNAFWERLRYDINEADVGMALLVHHSFPDEIELANGVATLAKGNRPDWSASVVSQKGAVSVTNPPADAVPEEVTIDAGFMGPRPWLAQRSSLVPLRENTVLTWEREYIELYDMLVAAAKEYCRVKQKDSPVLDFEFKKVAPEGRLVIKQIREIPQPGGTEYATPFMLGRPLYLCTLQGRGSNVFTNHRLKSRWTLTPRSMWLSEENLQESLYADVTLEYVADGQVRQLAAELPLLPEAEHTYTPPQWDFDQYDLLDNWRIADLCNPRTYRLRTEPAFQATVPHPVVTLADMRIGIEAEYAEPVWLSDTETTSSEGTALYRPWEPTAGDVPEEYSLDDPNTGVSIYTRCRVRWQFWGFGAPTSVQFESTRIEGLTTEPIVLTGYFSQSIGGGSHLCPKNFLFEPGLEPGISPQTLSELQSQNIRLIYFTTGARECRPTEWEDTPPLIRFYGFDDPVDGRPCSGR